MHVKPEILPRAVLVLFVTAILLVGTCCTKKLTARAQLSSVERHAGVNGPFPFVVYGDTRFHVPADTKAANPAVRVVLVQAIAEANPAFLCISGDIVYNGYDANDWKVYDAETSIWREKRLTIFPSLGNHDLRGD